MKNIFLSRLDYGNAGDLWSSPMHYLEKRHRGYLLDCYYLGDLPAEKDVDNIIIGGGALFCNNKFIAQMQDYLNKTSYKRLIVWGVGVDYNLDIDKFKSANMMGIREWLPGTDKESQWMPCASVFHPAIKSAMEIKPTKDFLIIDHWKRAKIELPAEHTRVSNNPATIDTIISAIADHRWVITSSYHAAYWATLLNRRVMVVSAPWQAKFDNFRHPPVKAEKFSWSLLDQARSYPGAYQECLAANEQFKKKFINLISSQ